MVLGKIKCNWFKVSRPLMLSLKPSLNAFIVLEPRKGSVQLGSTGTSVFVCVREKECVCVCVCVRERKRERERMCMCV